MGIIRYIKYKMRLSNRKRRYASLAVSLALAHASFGQVRYKSLGNGMADIELELKENNKFELHFNRLDEARQYRLKGKWEAEANNFILKFKRSKLDVPTLFSSNTGFQEASKIEGKRIVKIDAKRDGVVIWGIYCPKIDEAVSQIDDEASSF